MGLSAIGCVLVMCLLLFFGEDLHGLGELVMKRATVDISDELCVL